MTSKASRFVVLALVLVLLPVTVWLLGSDSGVGSAGALARMGSAGEIPIGGRGGPMGGLDETTTRTVYAGPGAMPTEGSRSVLEQPTRSLKGQVTLPSGEPAPGAHLSLCFEGVGRPTVFWDKVYSDRLGHFEFYLPELGAGRCQVLARSEGFGPGLVSFEGLPEFEVSVPLTLGVRVSGQVIGGDEVPVPVARIHLTASRENFAPWHRTEAIDGSYQDTDQRGRFAFEGVAPGRIEFVVSATGFATRTLDLQALIEDREDLSITLEPEQLVRGQVVDQGGNPVPDCEVVLVPRDDSRAPRPTSRTTENGDFLFRSIAAGEYAVMVQSPAFGPARVFVTIPQEHALTVVLEPACWLTGHLLGAPPVDFWVSLRTKSGERVALKSFSAVDFEFEGLPSGSFVVFVRSEGGQDQAVGEVELVPGFSADLGDIVLVGGSEVHGFVFPFAGVEGPGQITRCTLFTAPVPGENRRTISAVNTSREGEFTLVSVPAGRYTLHLSPEVGFPFETARFSVDGVTTIDLGVIMLSRGGAMEVTVLKDPKTPAPGFTVTISSDGGTIVFADTNALGVARFENLRPGLTTARVAIDGALRSEVSWVEEARTARVRFDLSSFSVQVWRGVLRNNGLPLGDRGVRATAADGSWDSQGGTTAEDGSFELGGAGDGDRVLDVYGVISPTAPVHVFVDSSHAQTLEPIELPQGVLDGVTTPPAPGASLVVSLVESATGGYGAFVGRKFAVGKCDEQGRYRIEYLEAGRYAVELFDVDGELLRKHEVSIKANTTTHQDL